MKKFAALFLLIFMNLSLFAKNPSAAEAKNQKKILIHKTAWFDLIYTKNHGAAAKILAENADRIYEDACAQYGISPQCRMPLVITQKNEIFNANWSSFTFNRIVIYDTFPDESLQVFEDSLLGTFWHEITHSITYNMKNDFWTMTTKIFGDSIYPGSLTIPRGLAEGSAVASESIGGEGRLNDEFSRQMVKQAKIEGKFPFYSDVQGASDKHPYGSFYNFNGEFYQWVQEKYGLKKFADFWYRLINLHSISVSGAFKKSFGQSLNSAWKEFADALQAPVPLAQKNPVESGLAQDFFAPDSKGYSKKNSSGALYANLRKSDAGLIYIDSKTDSLYFVEKSKISAFDSAPSSASSVSAPSAKKIAPKKLFAFSGIKNAAISRDGRFIAVNYDSARASDPKSKAAVYDRRSGTFANLKGVTNVHELLLAQNGGDYFLLCKRYESPLCKITAYKMDLNARGKIAGFTEFSSFALPYGQAILFMEEIPDFSGAGKITFAAIKKSGLRHSICVYSKGAAGNDANGGELNGDFNGGERDFELDFEAEIPGERTVARYLSYDENSGNLYFSYAQKDSMPRLGIFNLSQRKFKMTQDDFSGGIYYPVFAGQRLFYIGNFYRQNRILAKNTPFDAENAEDFKAENDLPENPDEKNRSTSKASLQKPGGELDSQPFSIFKLPKGLILPFSLCQSSSYNYGYKSSYSLPLGLSYINSNPVTNGTLTLSAGYGYETNSFGILAGYNGGSYTQLLKFSVQLSTEFDEDGWKQAKSTGSVSSAIPFGKISSLIFSDSAIIHYGRSNLPPAVGKKLRNQDFPGYARAFSQKKYFYFADSFTAGYSNIHKCGDGKYSAGGLAIYSVFTTKYNANNYTDLDKYEFYSDLGFVGKIALPRLIPLEDSCDFTFNLPTKITLCLFAQESEASFSLAKNWLSSSFPEFNACHAESETVIFGMDIQKGAGIFFFNDARIAFHYKIGFSYSEFDDADDWRLQHLGDYLGKLGDEVALEQSFGLKIAAGITPNYGIFANYLFKGDCYFEGGLALKDAESYGFARLGANFSF